MCPEAMLWRYRLIRQSVNGRGFLVSVRKNKQINRPRKLIYILIRIWLSKQHVEIVCRVLYGTYVMVRPLRSVATAAAAAAARTDLINFG